MTEQQGPLVSVVTPVFNGAPFLRECIESVRAQTYPHWEYIIVNNCSTDGTLAIAREYATRDPRIRIHNNEKFVRVIENYNVAFRQISRRSKYCKPVAADDLLLPECIERMVGLAEAHPNVAIVGAYGLYSQAELGVYCRGVPYPNAVVPRRDLARGYLLGSGPSIFGSPTYTLFRSDLLRSRPAFYNESNLHADSEACLESLEQHDFGFVQQILTFTRVQTGSLTAHSQQLHTYLPYWLYVLTRYGPKHLGKEELQRQIDGWLREYYHFLGCEAVKRRGRDFWKFHRGKLAALGYPLSRARVAAHALAYAANLALNPKATVEKIARRLRRVPAETSA